MEVVRCLSLTDKCMRGTRRITSFQTITIADTDKRAWQEVVGKHSDRPFYETKSKGVYNEFTRSDLCIP